MTKTITIVTGSARPKSAGVALAPSVKACIEQQTNLQVRIVNIKELNLPFVDSELTPSDKNFVPPHESVKEWQEIVRASDAVILLAPEYNNQISAIQKNAIDWLYADWQDKPIAIISYTWTGGELVTDLLIKLIKKVKAVPVQNPASLVFKKDIDTDGQVLDARLVNEKIRGVVEQLIKAM